MGFKTTNTCFRTTDHDVGLDLHRRFAPEAGCDMLNGVPGHHFNLVV